MGEISLVQISDLHFDKDIQNARRARTFDGYDAHDVQFCRALQAALFDSDGLIDMSKAHLFVGGDLTAIGVHDEFVTAQGYLTAQIPLPNKLGMKQQPLGLRHARERFWTIPGNHDHWNGQWQVPRGYHPGVFPAYFQPSPWVHAIRDGDLEFVLCSIDSNSYFEGFNRLRNVNPSAGGGFSQREREQFESAVRRAMHAPFVEGVKKRTAAILCHHPFTTDCAAQPLRPACSRWLLSLAAELGIPMVLTGHTHESWTELIPVWTARGTAHVREVRAPTAIQFGRTFPPDELRRRPGFCFHRLSLAPDLTLSWTIKLYMLAGGEFQCAADEDWIAYSS
jgi:hypothetical protein